MRQNYFFAYLSFRFVFGTIFSTFCRFSSFSERFFDFLHQLVGRAARSAGPGGPRGRSPPGRMTAYCASEKKLGRVNWCVASPFVGKTPSPLPRGHLPPHVFLPMSCSSNPTGRCRQGTPRKQQHDGVAHGSRAIHRGQGVSIKSFGGHPPLSDLHLPRRG